MVFAALYKMYKRSHWNEDIFKDRDSLFTVVSKNTSHCSSLGSDLVGNWTFSKKYGLPEWNKADQWKETQLVCRQRSCCQQCSPGWISASQLAADWPSVHLPVPPEPSVVGGGQLIWVTSLYEKYTQWHCTKITIDRIWEILHNKGV